MSSSGSTTGWSPLDQHIGWQLVQRGLMAKTAVQRLHAEGTARGYNYAGSAVLGAAVASQALTKSQADQVAEWVRNSAASSSPQASVEPNAAERRYELVEKVDEQLWYALDRHILRTVAVHRPAPGTPTEQFMRHPRVLAQMSHFAISMVHDMGALQGEPFFSTDQIDGQPLESVFTSDTPPPSLDHLLRGFLDICGAIDHAHTVGLLHTQLEPRHVHLGSFGRAWLTGWEQARPLAHASPSVRRATAIAPPDRSVDDAHRAVAPEIRSNGKLRRTTDVWGLGVILHWILLHDGPDERLDAIRQQRGIPRELAAITRKALAKDQTKRYASVAKLQHDLRRYLDGKEVEAERDTLVQASLRFLRRHPLTAAIGVTAAAILVVLMQLTYSSVRGRYQAALEKQQEANTQLTRAKKASRQIGATRSLAKDLERFEDAVREALSGGSQAVDPFATPSVIAAGLMDRAKEVLPDGATNDKQEGSDGLTRPIADGEQNRQAFDRFVMSQLHRAQGEYLLNRARPPQPALALESFRRLVAIEPTDAKAHFSRFIAARRLAGRENEQEEIDALNAAAALTGPFARLSRLELELRPLEDEAYRLARADPTTEVEVGPERERLGEQIEALVLERWDLAPVHELFGRYGQALAAPGTHRSQRIRKANSERKAKPRNTWGRSFDSYFAAMQLDPLDPVPRYLYVRVLNSKWGMHSFTRWIGGASFGHVARASRLTSRPGPILEAVDTLQRLGREAASISLLDQVLDEMPRPAQVRSGLDPWVRARIYRARAQLKAGHTAENDLRGLTVPPELAGEYMVLDGWRRLVTGQTADGVNLILDGFGRHHVSQLMVQDLRNAFCDPRVNGRDLIPFLNQLIPPASPQDSSGIIPILLLARATAASRTGMDATPDLERIGAMRQLVGGYSEARAIWRLAEARQIAARQPTHPAAHVYALDSWTDLNRDVDSTERYAYWAQELVVTRLRKLGLLNAAEQFASFDPVDELWVRRMWVPQDGHEWQAEQR